MALFTPSESPAVVVKEIDLTGGVPNVQSTTGALVGNFRWGPVEERKLIANEAHLVSNFASPDSSKALDFLSAVQYLRYSQSLQVVRVGGKSNSRAAPGQNLLDSHGTLSTVRVKNAADWTSQEAALDIADHTFIAKYPGGLGNSLSISMCQPDSDVFDAWDYKNSFDTRPGTSTFAQAQGARNDEVHMVIVDTNGKFTGTKGTILETYPYVSVAKNATGEAGTSNYIKTVVNAKSQYVWMAGFDSDYNISYNHINTGNVINPNVDSATTISSVVAGTDADSGDIFWTNISTSSSLNWTFAGGADSSPGIADYLTGFDLFEDKDQVEIDFLIAPSISTRQAATTVVNDLVATAASLRKDCVVIASPTSSDVVNQNNIDTAVSNSVATANTFTASSYLIVDGTWLKVYDKYNDQYVQISASSTTAGIMAATDLNRAAWFSPAGSRRGQYLGITSLSYSPTKAQRDTLYKNGINPVANIPGHGVILFGDKTKLGRVSAFDRINVRRLFLVLERAIARAAEQVLFEFNDEFTRAEFVNIVEPVLREVKGRRGITDFKVVADETNNTAEVVDRNEFIANIFIKPARSINYVTLNFVAVRTGVDFTEVVGTV